MHTSFHAEILTYALCCPAEPAKKATKLGYDRSPTIIGIPSPSQCHYSSKCDFTASSPASVLDRELELVTNQLYLSNLSKLINLAALPPSRLRAQN